MFDKSHNNQSPDYNNQYATGQQNPNTAHHAQQNPHHQNSDSKNNVSLDSLKHLYGSNKGPMKKTLHDYSKHLNHGKDDISILKLVNYNLLFFIPILISLAASIFISGKVAHLLEVSPLTAAEIILFPFVTIIFIVIIPYIRQREKIKGVRLSLIAFLLVAFFMTVPGLFAGNYGMLLRQFIFVATYILLVFIFCPEVLGISGDIAQWFKKGKQATIVGIYVSIVFFYILGFAWLYYSIYLDTSFGVQHYDVPSFMHDEVKYGDMLYYSIITFASIGYGEITPMSGAARLVAGFEALTSMIINVLFVALILVYVSNSQAFAEKRIEEEEEKIEKEESMLEKEERKIEAEEKRIEDAEKKEMDYIHQMQSQGRIQ